MSISVCVLARDEAHNLEACLRPLTRQTKDLEIIVVDNGSTDRTAEVSRGLGAKVYSSPHTVIDQGRNAYLEVATQPWIFVIDADERMTASGVRALLKGIHQVSPSIAGFALPRYEYFGGGKWSLIHLPRLFRNHPGIRYTENAIHDTPALSILGVGSISTALYAPLHHTDIVDSRRKRSKRERYRDALLSALQRAPDARMYRFLGLEYLAIHNYSRAEDALKMALQFGPDRDLHSEIFLAQLYLRTGKYEEAWNLVTDIAKRDLESRQGIVGPQCQTAVIQAELLLKAGETSAAVEALTDGFRIEPNSAHLHLNLASLLKEDLQLAKHHLRQALRINPFMLRPIIYNAGVRPNLFVHQSVFLENTKNFIAQMVELDEKAGGSLNARRWKMLLAELMEEVPV